MHATSARFVARLLLAASSTMLAACGGGGDAAGPAPNAAAVDTLVFSIQTAEVIIGDTLRLTVVARDASGNAVPNVPVTWRSLNPAVATVSAQGLVTGVDIGEAVIEAEANVAGGVGGGGDPALFVDTSKVHTAALRKRTSQTTLYSVPNVVLSPGNATVGVKQSQQFTARITKQNGDELGGRPAIGWSSSNPSVATIGSDGVAVGVSAGTTTIKLVVSVGNSWDVKRTATLTVKGEACGGIASVAQLQGAFTYKYAVARLTDDGQLIESEYKGSFTAVMDNQTSGSPNLLFAFWTGPLQGSASQMETVTESESVSRFEGEGKPISAGFGIFSNMNVRVDLTNCTFGLTVFVSLNLKKTEFGQTITIPTLSATAYVGRGKNMTGLEKGQPDFPILTGKFGGHSGFFAGANLTQDAFVPGGFAARLMQGTATEPEVGAADVFYTVSPIKP